MANEGIMRWAFALQLFWLKVIKVLENVGVHVDYLSRSVEAVEASLVIVVI